MNYNNIHPSWRDVVEKALASLSADYLKFLREDKEYFPDYSNFLNAFKTLSKEETKIILFGQDPYPRKKSAIGYAFIDGDVDEIFGINGFSTKVNKATSLRNFLKMQFIAQGHLSSISTTQEDIAKLKKDKCIKNIFELKNNFEKNGILLLNTALVFTSKADTKHHIKEFKPFLNVILSQMAKDNIELVLFGNIAKDIEKILPKNNNFKIIKTPHPYNLSFIQDKSVIEYFKKFKLVSY